MNIDLFTPAGIALATWLVLELLVRLWIQPLKTKPGWESRYGALVNTLAFAIALILSIAALATLEVTYAGVLDAVILALVGASSAVGIDQARGNAGRLAKG